MNKLLPKNNRVSLCHKDNCIHATGKNADMIAQGATIMLVLVGIGAFLRAISK
jgi:hypothetical protein